MSKKLWTNGDDVYQELKRDDCWITYYNIDNGDIGMFRDDVKSTQGNGFMRYNLSVEKSLLLSKKDIKKVLIDNKMGLQLGLEESKTKFENNFGIINYTDENTIFITTDNDSSQSINKIDFNYLSNYTYYIDPESEMDYIEEDEYLIRIGEKGDMNIHLNMTDTLKTLSTTRPQTKTRNLHKEENPQLKEITLFEFLKGTSNKVFSEELILTTKAHIMEVLPTTNDETIEYLKSLMNTEG